MLVLVVGGALAAAGGVGAGRVLAQDGTITAPAPVAPSPATPSPATLAALAKVPVQLSTECKVKHPAFEGRSALWAVRHALRDKRPIRVLEAGVSTSLSSGAASAVASYPVRLENDLEGFLKGFEVDMISRGLSDEISGEAAERLKREVAEIRPDLLVWQVGTADALARVDTAEFVSGLRDTLHWLADNHIDVVLIDPQYSERMKNDSKYNEIVRSIGDVAKAERVLLVRRFDAMAELSGELARNALQAPDRVALTDLGYRCMAEYAARAIVGGILQAELGQTPKN